MRQAFHWTCVIVAVSCLACAASLPPAESPPATSPRTETPAALPESQITLPLTVPVRMLEEMAAQAVQLPSQERFERLGTAGDNPEVEVRYRSRLGGVRLSSHRGALRTSIEVLYHGELRARARTPFGRIWLSRGTAWGSARDPARIEVEIHTRLSVRPDWTLKASSTLKEVRLTAPAMARLCTSGPVKLCLGREQAARLVHSEIETLVKHEVTAALRDLDRKLVAHAQLKPVAHAMWQRLHSSQAGVLLAPRAISIASPEVRDEQLLLNVRVRAQPRFHDLDAQPQARLPSPSRQRGGGDVLHLGWPLSWQAWGEALTRQARLLPLGAGELRIDRVVVRGAADQPGHFWWTIALTGRPEPHTVHVKVQLAATGDQLATQTLSLTPDSRARLAALGFRPEHFLQLLQDGTPLDLRALLEEPVRRLRRALRRSVQPLPVDVLRDLRLTLQGVYAQPHGLWLQVRSR